MSEKDYRPSAAVLNELQFYLRTPGANVYGPVSYLVLAQWAEAGRVAGGDEVSHDRKLWMPATNLPDLKMEWLGRRVDGKEFGPFNLLAVPHLIQHGLLDPACTLTHRLTGRTVAVASFVNPAGLEASSSQGSFALPPSDPATATGQPAAAQEEVKALHARLSELERAQARHADELALSAGRLDKAQDDLHTANLLLEAARIELQRQKKNTADSEVATDANAKATKALANLRRENEELKKAATNHKRSMDQANGHAAEQAQKGAAEARALQLLNESLETRHADMQARMAALQSEFAGTQRASEALRQDVENLKKCLIQAKDEFAIQAQKGAAEIRQLRQAGAEFEARQTDSLSRAAALQSELAGAQRAAEALRQEQAAGAAQGERLSLNLEAAEQQRAETEKALRAARHRADESDRDAAARQRENGALRAEVREVRAAQERAAADFARDLASLRAIAEPARWTAKFGESVYGPVSTTEMYAWAADCRIAPDTEVARDGAPWRKAREVPELCMEWSIQLVDGTGYGPVNLLAVSHLVKDGSAQPGAAVTNCRTGTKLTAAELAHPLALELRNTILRLEKELAEFRRALTIKDHAAAAIDRHMIPGAPSSSPQEAPPPPRIVIGTVRARARRAAEE